MILAAFSIAFTFYYTLTSGTEVSTLLSISFLRDRRSIRHLFGFFCVVLALPFAVAQAVAWTVLGAWLYGGVFGASAEVIPQAQLATFYLSLSAPVLLFRAQAFALLMVNRRTIWITMATLLRLLSLGVSLAIYPYLMPGAAVGAAALATCMAVEAAFAWWAARGFFRALPQEAEPLPRYGELWRFSWPLMLAQVMEMGIATVINIFLGRLANPDLALASFGVVHGLAGLMLSPMRNLVQTAQTLARTRADVRVLVRFTTWLVVIFTVAIGGLFFSPARGWVLRDVMGLGNELAAYSEPAVLIMFLIAGVWGYAALFRGLLASARRTTAVALSSVFRVGVVMLVGSATLVVAGLNGAVIGIVAWAATFAAEAIVLGGRLLSRHGGTAVLFPEGTGGASTAQADARRAE